MPTELVSIHDPLIFECTATVTAVDDARPDGGCWFVTDRTCFYPEGGGQPSDRGSYMLVSDYGKCGVVTEVHKIENGDIAHYIDGFVPVVGDELKLTVDKENGMAIRRFHTALHVLCGVIWKEYGVKVTGSQSRGDSARMDFGFPDWKPELKDEIEAKVNDALSTGAPVKIYTLPADEARTIPDLIRTDSDLLPEGLTHIRIVEIVGIDLQADGGPHVSNLKEVGRIRIEKVKNKGAGFRRLEIVLV